MSELIHDDSFLPSCFSDNFFTKRGRLHEALVEIFLSCEL